MEDKKIKREFSAAGIVFKPKGKEILWLVLKPTGDEKWRFPKGKINTSESSVAASKREVREETGVEPEILGKIGEEKFFFVENKQKIFKTVVFYLMKYLKQTEIGFNKETEAIAWLPFLKAKKRLAFNKDQDLLEKAKNLLAHGEAAMAKPIIEKKKK
jgi:8-oxo-dGTP pyrophosphatase MutT (NUDIX family)